MYNYLFVHLFVLRERSFGCDLGEHLAKTNSQGEELYFNHCMLHGFLYINIEMIFLVRKCSGDQASVWSIAFLKSCRFTWKDGTLIELFVVVLVPLVLTKCAEVIEKNGIVDGIYRLSGMSSNIQKLR